MKKKSRLTIIFASALLCMGLYVTPFTGSADEAVESVETSEIVSVEEVVEETESVENTPNDEVVEGSTNIIPESKGSKWFEETIQPYLLEYGVMLLAMFTAAMALLKKAKKVLTLFIEAVQSLKIANARVEKAEAEMKALREENASWETRMEEKIQETVNTLADALKAVLVDKVEDIDMVVNKILEVEELAYKSNPALVGNGTAKKICEVIHK